MKNILILMTLTLSFFSYSQEIIQFQEFDQVGLTIQAKKSGLKTGFHCTLRSESECLKAKLVEIDEGREFISVYDSEALDLKALKSLEKKVRKLIKKKNRKVYWKDYNAPFVLTYQILASNLGLLKLIAIVTVIYDSLLTVVAPIDIVARLIFVGSDKHVYKKVLKSLVKVKKQKQKNKLLSDYRYKHVSGLLKDMVSGVSTL